MSIPNRSPWKAIEDQILIDMWATPMTRESIGVKLRRSATTVTKRAKFLELGDKVVPKRPLGETSRLSRDAFAKKRIEGVNRSRIRLMAAGWSGDMTRTMTPEETAIRYAGQRYQDDSRAVLASRHWTPLRTMPDSSLTQSMTGCSAAMCSI